MQSEEHPEAVQGTESSASVVFFGWRYHRLSLPSDTLRSKHNHRLDYARRRGYLC